MKQSLEAIPGLRVSSIRISPSSVQLLVASNNTAYITKNSGKLGKYVHTKLFVRVVQAALSLLPLAIC